MASVDFEHIDKIYPGGTQAVFDFNLTVADGEALALVGPSGCGKSTLLRLLAGLETATRGTLRIGGQAVNDQPPQRRNVAMVFQDYALYPHMSVRENLGFPLRMQGVLKDEIRRRVDETAELLGLKHLLERKPRQLSGGQRQRVAMGRAVVRQPSVFLMDEPLSNVDAKLRVQIRTEIAALQERLDTTTIYVTHDQVEAMTLGDRVMVLRDGVVQQVASPQKLYDRPANAFVATFLGNPGMNIVATSFAEDENGNAELDLRGQRLPLPATVGRDLHSAKGQGAFIGVRPEALLLTEPGEDSLSLPITVSSVESLGHEQLVYCRLPDPEQPEARALDEAMSDFDATPGQLVARLPATPVCHVGTQLRLAVESWRVHVFDVDGVCRCHGLGASAVPAEVQ
ncbi:MAG: ABC transporter ATP-binding protein [Rhodospirillales bacterium]|nr:ABC transporter ATP-binding protein [Rhodospirillales bacterium]